MAPNFLSIVFLSLLVFTSILTTDSATSPPKPKAFIFPIKKDVATNQYYTSIEIGVNSTSLNVVIDLGGKFMFFNSMDYFQSSSGYRPILCGTRQCRIAAGVGCVFCYLSPPVPGCTNNTCTDYVLNPFSGTQSYSGLSEDILRVYSTTGVRYNFTNFPFQYADPILKDGLASSASGVIGLARTRISLQAQLASNFKIREKFALCIPATGNDGGMIFGQASYGTPPFQGIYRALTTTSLIRNPIITDMSDKIGNLSVEYFINVKSVRVGNKTLSFDNSLLSINKRNGSGGTNLRTVRHYSVLHESIYRALVKEFVSAAAAKNIRRVATVSPFGACFDSKTIVNAKTGPDVPTIDFVLENSKTFWRFYGSNSIVRVSNGVSCLAFVDGGPTNSFIMSSIVIGGYQMQDHLLEFDVASSKFRFSSTLLLQDTSCSQFKAS